jgi:hypothetical protein
LGFLFCERQKMTEVIVAIFANADHADKAITALDNAGIPSSSIIQHSSDFGTHTRTTAFWETLLGAEPKNQYDTTIYNHAIANGATVLTVNSTKELSPIIIKIMNDNQPLDIEEMIKNLISKDMTIIPMPDDNKILARNTESMVTIRHYIIADGEPRRGRGEAERRAYLNEETSKSASS